MYVFKREVIGAKYTDIGHTEFLDAKISVYVNDINTHHNSNKEHHNIIIWKNLLDMSGGTLSQQNAISKFSLGIS
jgi:hypothetical protein